MVCILIYHALHFHVVSKPDFFMCFHIISLHSNDIAGETLFLAPLLVNIALVAFLLVFLTSLTDGPLQWIEV